MSQTTIRIDDELLARAKAFAALHRRSMNSVVEDALREMLVRRQEREKPPVRIPTFGGEGLQPGVDLDDNAALRDLMDEGEPLDRLR